MTLRKRYSLRCDIVGCGATIDTIRAEAGRSSSAARDARQYASRSGWRRRDERDLCPPHATMDLEARRREARA